VDTFGFQATNSGMETDTNGLRADGNGLHEHMRDGSPIDGKDVETIGCCATDIGASLSTPR